MSLEGEMALNEFLSKEYVYRMQKERFKAFKEQDTEQGHFDVTFEIEERILHAHKSTLTPVSERFDAWLSDRWSTKDKPVKVEDSSYENFYQFLCFIYSGFCKINRGNAFQLTDMAESYGVTCFKEFCDKFLSDMEYTAENVEEMFEYATLYTLPKLIDSIKTYATLPEGDDIYREEKFLAFKKPFVQLLSTLPRDPDYLVREQYRFRYIMDEVSSKCRKESEFFEIVYKWAERQVMNKATTSDDEYDVQEAIKAELETIIPHPKFCDMNYDFLLNFVVEKEFFLSAAQFGKFFVKYRDAKQYVDEDILFKSIYELSEKQTLLKQKTSFDPDNFNFLDSIKADLAESIPHVRFYRMNEKFLLDFVVEKLGFTFTPTELAQFYQNCFANDDECFRRVYRLAEKQALEKQNKAPVDNFNLLDSIKADLVETIPNVNFCRMTEEFLMDFVVEKCGFTFSSTELSKFYQGLHRVSLSEEKRFERIYRLTEKQALIKQQKAPADNFDLAETIKTDLVEVIPFIHFSKMDKTFLIDFVVGNGYILSPTDLSKFYLICTGTATERFKQVYELAEKQGLKKQMMSSDSDNFNLAETIKTDMAKVIPQTNFCHTDKEYLMDFLLEKGFFLSPTYLSKFYERGPDICEEKRFEIVYELAEKLAMQKQKTSSDPDNVNLLVLIKAFLFKTIPLVKFYMMSKSFLMDFVLEKGFTLSRTGLSNFHIKCTGTERERFIQVYELAEKQALQKQKMSPDPDNFNIAETIKADISNVKFYLMDKRFLNDFIVAKGIITKEQALHLYDIHFEVEHNGRRIRGTLEDNADICRIVRQNKSCAVRRNNIRTAKRRFIEFKLPVPSSSSSVQKMVGCEWYLCFERDRVLTLKHHSLVQRSDYLLAEMKGDTDFELGPDGLTTLIAKCNNI